MKQSKYIYFGVFFYSFVVQVVTISSHKLSDHEMWTDQIKYFLNHDPRVFDFYAAYGHPGTTLVELGSLFHTLMGITCSNALILSMGILIASSTAACAVMCFLLHQQSLWWLTTALILSFNRLVINSPPPTATVLPFIALIVLATWWLWDQQNSKSRWLFIMWGGIIGLSAATRLDITLLVSVPMFLLIWYRYGHGTVVPILAGAGISFFVADPFLWFMPIQHLTDLVYKFTLHYTHFNSHVVIDAVQYAHAIPLAIASIIWAFVLLVLRLLTRIIPLPIIVVFFGVSLLALIIVYSSTFQAIRYLYPLIIVWEILLPLFALETFSPTFRHEQSGSHLHITATSWTTIGFVILTQILAYLQYS